MQITKRTENFFIVLTCSILYILMSSFALGGHVMQKSDSSIIALCSSGIVIMATFSIFISFLFIKKYIKDKTVLSPNTCTSNPKYTKNSNVSYKWKNNFTPVVRTLVDFWILTSNNSNCLISEQEFQNKIRHYCQEDKVEFFPSAHRGAWPYFPNKHKFQGGETKAQYDKKMHHN